MTVICPWLGLVVTLKSCVLMVHMSRVCLPICYNVISCLQGETQVCSLADRKLRKYIWGSRLACMCCLVFVVYSVAITVALLASVSMV